MMSAPLQAIRLGSTSYPFWAIARHFAVPYADVIAYWDRIPSALLRRDEPWMAEVWKEYYRRVPDEAHFETNAKFLP